MSEPALDVAGLTIQGQRRRQEDAWHLERFGPSEVLAIVADGLGGHPAGDLASRAAVDEFVSVFADLRAREAGNPRRWLQEATVGADLHLRALQEEDQTRRGMATTLVAAYRSGVELWTVSVGDSYVLLWRRGQLYRLNELHTERGGVTSCIGYNLSRMDLAEVMTLEDADRLLLASDGLTTLDDEQVSRLFEAATGAEALVRAAIAAIEQVDHPGQDNATLVAICPPR